MKILLKMRQKYQNRFPQFDKYDKPGEEASLGNQCLFCRIIKENDKLLYKDEFCAICLNYLVPPKSPNLLKRVKRLPCNHQFHIACINKWLDKFNTCPLCRDKINSSSSDFFG